MIVNLVVLKSTTNANDWSWFVGRSVGSSSTVCEYLEAQLDESAVVLESIDEVLRANQCRVDALYLCPFAREGAIESSYHHQH